MLASIALLHIPAIFSFERIFPLTFRYAEFWHGGMALEITGTEQIFITLKL